MATLFGAPASHPSLSAELMLKFKGIPYRRIDFVPALHRGFVRAAGFPGVTVPALRIDGRKVQGTRDIARALDEIRPEPPLFPADAERRSQVEVAERWGDEQLQPVARRMAWASLKRDRSTMKSYLKDAKLGIPVGLAAKTAPPLVFLSARLNHATDDAIKQDLAALPALLDRVDAWISQGVIGGAERNAADFQIAPTLRLLESFDDVKPLLAGRPCGSYARDVVPAEAGHQGPTLPREWLSAT